MRSSSYCSRAIRIARVTMATVGMASGSLAGCGPSTAPAPRDTVFESASPPAAASAPSTSPTLAFDSPAPLPSEPTGATDAGASSGQNFDVKRPSDAGMIVSPITRPRLLRQVPPVYTAEAMEKHVEGRAILKCVVTTDGSLENCRVLKGLPGMDEAILAAVLQWRYSPALFEGRPVKIQYVVVINVVAPPPATKRPERP